MRVRVDVIQWLGADYMLLARALRLLDTALISGQQLRFRLPGNLLIFSNCSQTMIV